MRIIFKYCSYDNYLIVSPFCANFTKADTVFFLFTAVLPISHCFLGV